MGCTSSKKGKNNEINKDKRKQTPSINNLKKVQKDRISQVTNEKTPASAQPMRFRLPHHSSPKINESEQQQLERLGEFLPHYSVTMDYINSRKELRTPIDEPIPILREELHSSFLMRKRQFHNKLQQHKLVQLQLCEEKQEEDVNSIDIHPTLKDIYQIK